MIGDLENDSGIVRYRRAQADGLAAKIRELSGDDLIVRTELFDYAREIGIMITRPNWPGYQEIRIAGRQLDVDKLAQEIVAGIE